MRGQAAPFHPRIYRVPPGGFSTFLTVCSGLFYRTFPPECNILLVKSFFSKEPVYVMNGQIRLKDQGHKMGSKRIHLIISLSRDPDLYLFQLFRAQAAK